MHGFLSSFPLYRGYICRCVYPEKHMLLPSLPNQEGEEAGLGIEQLTPCPIASPIGQHWGCVFSPAPLWIWPAFESDFSLANLSQWTKCKPILFGLQTVILLMDSQTEGLRLPICLSVGNSLKTECDQIWFSGRREQKWSGSG